VSGAATIELKAGDPALPLAPTLGGVIAGFRRKDFSLMRLTPPKPLSEGRVQFAVENL
jgi:hypothetical protein